MKEMGLRIFPSVGGAVRLLLIFGFVVATCGQEMLPRPLPLKGWSTPSPGWVSPVAPNSVIDVFGGVEAVGQGSAQASHSSSITATGSGSSTSGWKAVGEDPVASYVFARDP